MYCKHCGALIDDDSKFCHSCGNSLSGEAAQQPQAPKAPCHPQNATQDTQSKSAGGVKEFLSACWNGEKSLVFTYWVIFVFLGGFTNILGNSESFNRWLGSLGLIAVLFYFAALVCIIVFQCVSVWRSAGRYSGWAGWKIIARICVGLCIVNSILGLFISIVNAAQ